MSPRLPVRKPEGKALGIVCPRCQSSRSRVLFRKKRTYGYRRRLRCTECGHRFPTREIVDE